MGDNDYGFVVIHIPHSSVEIPEEYRKDFVISQKEIDREVRRMTDSYCHDLFDAVGFDNMIIASISRLVCDVERFRDDKLEYNARFGHGLMYTRTSTGKKMREKDNELRERILEKIYDPHHLKLTNAVKKALEKYGKCLIIDGHSFNSDRIVKFDNIFSMPDFDIGTDSFHTPETVSGALYEQIKKMGYRPRFNSPYGGAITPMEYYNKDARVASIMIEVNRKLYMNEKTMEKTADFEKTRKACHELMYKAADASKNAL